MPDEPEDFLPLTPATLQILTSLMGGAAHGYGLKADIEERTDGAMRLGAGTLYAGLQRMERDGLIIETNLPEGEERVSSRQRFYAITALGRRVLKAELRRLEADVRAVRTALADPGSA